MKDIYYIFHELLEIENMLWKCGRGRGWGGVWGGGGGGVAVEPAL